MKDAERRTRFLTWYEKTYGSPSESTRTAFIEETGKHGYKKISKTQASFYFNSEKQFGEKAARSLALRLGEHPDLFLQDSPATSSTEFLEHDIALGRVWVDMLDIRNINPEAFAQLADRIHAIAEGARASDIVLGRRSKLGYVDPERIRQTLGQLAPPSPASLDSPPTHGELLEATKRESKVGKDRQK